MKFSKTGVACILAGTISIFALAGFCIQSEAKEIKKFTSPGGIKIEQLEDSLNRTVSIFTDEATGVQYLVIEKGGSQGAVAIQPLLNSKSGRPLTERQRME